jgi:hypothetical protein
MDVVEGDADTLRAVFDTELTAATAVCARCGAARTLGELLGFADAPGVVARCAACGHVLLAIVRRERIAYVDASGFAAINAGAGAPA